MVVAAELTEPVAYSPWWLLVAVALPLLVIGWYVGVTRTTRPVPPSRGGTGLESARREHLGRLDAIEAAVAARTLSHRAAHQQISAVVRSFVSDVGPVDARTMSLAQLREAGEGLAPVAGVVALVELTYPPAFRPGDRGGPVERLAPALHEAREVVRGWQP